MTTTTNEKLKPDREDYDYIEHHYGRLPKDASDADCAHHYRLAVARKLIRLEASRPTHAGRKARVCRSEQR